MDFTQGFHQIGLNPITAYLTTFMGIYEFTRVPFGPKNAPSWYQQLMAGEIYVDDCIVYGETQITLK